MTTSEILATLRSRGVTLAVENGKLKYRGAKDVLTPELIGEMRRQKESLIALLNAENDEPRRETSRRMTRSGPRITPLSPGERVAVALPQESLWFHHQMDPTNVADHSWAAWSLEGELDRTALRRALDALVKRHESLRLQIEPAGEEAWLSVVDPFPAPLEIRSLSERDPAERDREIARLCTEYFQRKFDLSAAPLFRFMLLEVRPDHHLMVWVCHHIIVDGVSLAIMQRDMAALYAANLAGKTATLPDLPVEYRDFAAWQRATLTDERVATLRDYWTTKIPSNLAPLELPTDRARPAVQTHDGGIVPINLSRELADAVRKLAREENCTLFVTLMAAYKTLLHRLANQTDIVVAVPVSIRQLPELADMVGMLVNTLPLYTDLSGDPTFPELLQRERRTFFDALAHQDLPFQMLVEAVDPPRDASRNPIFQALLEVLSESNADMPGLTIGSHLIEHNTSQFDLSLHLRDSDTGLNGWIEYNAAVFDAATIERFVESFEALLGGIVANRAAPISRFPLLSDCEREKITHDWNATARDYPRDVTLMSLFEDQVARTPDATALVYDGVELSYRELDHRANRLAHHLAARGVAPERPVGLFLERDIDMVVAIYATLKAGGAYMPLDPDYPSERIAFMIDESVPAVVLTQSHLEARLPETNAPTLVLDSSQVREALAVESADAPAPRAAPNNLAYIIYTSGSTGRPKGVMIEHEAICNRLFWMQEEYGLGPGDVVLQKTPFSFDVSVWEFFWPLQVGASLVVARPGGHRESAYLIDTIEHHGVTTMHFVPSMLEAFLDDRDVPRCSSLRRVFCSGEALPFSLQQRFFENLDCELHNLYGPTEAAVDVTYWACQPDGAKRMVPIGRPVANTEIYILDEHLQPVPIGAHGELHIGGLQLARGYLNRPDLTEERFIPDPFSADPGARLYKTGDLCRYLPDGNIDYIGRIDFQVKIRGLRIELGEIETAILDAVDAPIQTVVSTWSPAPADVRLVAYIATGPHEVDVDEVREKMCRRLPDYMIPQHFQLLREFPLTSSGKTDRKQLPTPELVSSDREIVPPASDEEQPLFEIWQETLARGPASRADNFFASGGHSLLAMKFTGRIEREFGVQVPLRMLLLETLGDVADHVLQAAGEDEDSMIPRREPSAPPAAIAPTQIPLFILQRFKPDLAANNVWSCFTIEGGLDRDAFQAAVNALVARQENLRMTIDDCNGDQVLLNVAPPFEADVAFRAISELPPSQGAIESERILADFIRRPFDFEAGPLFRFLLIEEAPDRHTLLLVIHHIICDGVSLAVLLDELAANYAAIRATGKPAALPELRVQFPDFAAWQNERLTPERLDALADYWRGAVPAEQEALQLPIDRPRPSEVSFVGDVSLINWPSERSPCAAPTDARSQRDDVHHPAGLLEGPVAPAQRSGRHRRRRPRRPARQSRPLRYDRYASQHAAAAHRDIGRGDLPRDTRSGALQLP